MEHLATKKDYYAVVVIGFFFGLLCVPIINNLGVLDSPLGFSHAGALALAFAVFAVIALGIAAFLGRKIPALFQFAKFGAVGALGTFIDLGVLNGLIAFTGRATGVWYALFKTASFFLANINNYFWNKHWVFTSRDQNRVGEFVQFFTVSLVGLLINVGTATIIVEFLPRIIHGVSDGVWANVGALGAVILSLIWNFAGYKYFVFAVKEKPTINKKS